MRVKWSRRSSEGWQVSRLKCSQCITITLGCGRPSLKQLNDHVIEAVAVKWRDLGFQLLNSDSAQNILDIIEANHKQVS